MTNVLVDNTSLTAIANAIRSKNGTNTTYKPAQMDDAINDLLVVRPAGVWNRPSAYPDYSKLDISEQEAIYLTYATYYTDQWISVRVYGAYTIVRGSLSNGIFTATSTATNMASAGVFREALPTNEGDYIVYKITPQEGASLTRFEFARRDDENSSIYFQGWNQPCVERYARMPNWIGVGNKSNNQYVWSTRYLRADTIFDATAITSLANAYNDGGFVLQYVDLSTCSFANITAANGMFQGEYNLRDVYLPHDLSDKCTNISNMFYNTLNVQSLDLTGWDTSKVTNMSNMFYADRNLIEIKGIEDFDVSSVTLINGCFNGCRMLGKLDLSKWETGTLTNISSCFNDCYCLTSIDVSGFKTASVTDFGSVFAGCLVLTDIDISDWSVTTACTKMGSMFAYCRGLKNIIRTKNWNTSNVTDFSSMFRECRLLETIDVSDFNTSKATSMRYMFMQCNSLKSLNISNFDMSLISNDTNVGDFASNCWLMKNITLPSTKVLHFPSLAYDYCITEVVFPSSVTTIGASNLRNMEHCQLFDFRNATAVPTLSTYTDITNGWNNKIKIVVPDSLYSTWIATAQWNNATLVAAIVSASTYEASLA